MMGVHAAQGKKKKAQGIDVLIWDKTLHIRTTYVWIFSLTQSLIELMIMSER